MVHVASATCPPRKPLGGLAQQGLELGEGQFDGVRVGRVGRRVDEPGAGRIDRLAHALDLVGGEIVHDDECRRSQAWAPGSVRGR